MRSILSLIATMLWFGVSCTGLWRLYRYETTPGPGVMLPGRPLPASVIPRSDGQYSLLLFAHPKCPCTRATIDELDRLMTQCRGKLTTSAYFVKPGGCSDTWVHTDLWRRAEEIPGVRVYSDLNGEITRKMGAYTSGQAVLLDRSGNILFQGGITSGRGHAGDSSGRSAIVSIVNSGKFWIRQSPVFGCPIIECPNPDYSSATGARASRLHSARFMNKSG